MRLAPLVVSLLAACGEEPAPDGAADPDDAPLEYVDAGIPDRPDAGPPVEVEVCLPLAPLPASQLPRCEAATRDCVTGCADAGDQAAIDACHSACWANDPTPPAGDTGCDDCVFIQLLSCIDAGADGACHPPVAAFMCCLAGGGVGCEDEQNALFTCGFYTTPECFDLTGGAIGQCYAEAP